MHCLFDWNDLSTSLFVCPSEPEQNQLQDDPNGTNHDVGNHHKQPPSPFYDNSDPLQPDGTDNYTGTPNSSDIDEHEQQDAVLQAEWHAHAMAIQALNQLRSDSATPSVTGSNDEPGDGNTPANLSHIKSIKFTQEFI
jgi:hypothetical protein